MHILLFILIFIIAIFVFGLSIVGFILRTIFGLGRSSSSSRPKQTESGRTSQQSYTKRIAVQMMMKKKYIPRMFRRKDIKKYSPRMMANM